LGESDPEADESLLKETWSIRTAKPSEAALLSELACRSKAYWGYSVPFMAAFRQSLTLTPEQLGQFPSAVLEESGRILGFYTLRELHGAPYLDDLFVTPDAIGVGVGTALWTHMLQEAKSRGYSSLRIESDPYAEAFYRLHGAVRIGSVPSTLLEGRMLPLLEVRMG
jgi:GNAT superfamily N-acetyltransferase